MSASVGLASETGWRGPTSLGSVAPQIAWSALGRQSTITGARAARTAFRGCEHRRARRQTFLTGTQRALFDASGWGRGWGSAGNDILPRDA